MNSERELALQIAKYLQTNFPNILFRFDLAADLKLSIGQAKRQKRLHPNRGYPDLFIAQPNKYCHGQYLELKKEGTTVWLKNGQLTSDSHIREQMATLIKLRMLGYNAQMVVGWDATKKAIDDYMQDVEPLLKSIP